MRLWFGAPGAGKHVGLKTWGQTAGCPSQQLPPPPACSATALPPAPNRQWPVKVGAPAQAACRRPPAARALCRCHPAVAGCIAVHAGVRGASNRHARVWAAWSHWGIAGVNAAALWCCVWACSHLLCPLLSQTPPCAPSSTSARQSRAPDRVTGCWQAPCGDLSGVQWAVSAGLGWGGGGSAAAAHAA